MIRFYAPIIMISALMGMVACSGRDPVADDLNAAAAPAEVDVLPPDENLVAPANEPENEGAEPVGVASTIPASLHGRWGLTPGDCTSSRGDAKGLMTIGDTRIKFYESTANLTERRPAIATSFSAASIACSPRPIMLAAKARKS